LPKWQIERSLDDFARLYESYNHQVPDSHLMKKKLPKPPSFLRSRFGMGSWTSNIREGDANHSGNGEGAADGDELTVEDAFDPKSAKKLTSELQTFLQEMIQYAIYLPGAERMCKFLELSALTLALGRDGGYQGKEGYLTVVKQKRLMDEGPLANAVKKVIRKPISKYFVVRDSFIIVAASHKNVSARASPPIHMLSITPIVQVVHLISLFHSRPKSRTLSSLTLRSEPTNVLAISTPHTHSTSSTRSSSSMCGLNQITDDSSLSEAFAKCRRCGRSLSDSTVLRPSGRMLVHNGLWMVATTFGTRARQWRWLRRLSSSWIGC
jgi:hypothetical protein